MKNVKSEWPSALICDEIWLKSHRYFVHALEESQLWMNTGEYETMLSAQHELGCKLKANVLKKVLGESDYAVIHSESAFGSHNQHLKAKLPFALAFGYEMGAGFFPATNGNEEIKLQAARVSALFNLGISVFDLVFDNYDELINEISALFDRNVLTAIHKDLKSTLSLTNKANRIPQDEIRILIKLIAGFYNELNILRRHTEGGEITKQLFQLLKRAYSAEINSQIVNGQSMRSLMAIGRNKSALPFQIMQELSLQPYKQAMPVYDKILSRHIGTIFWLLDDLVDLLKDFNSRELNSLLTAKANGNDLNEHELFTGFHLTEILSGSIIERTCNKIVTSLKEAFLILDSGEPENEGFKKLLLFYIRNWIS